MYQLWWQHWIIFIRCYKKCSLFHLCYYDMMKTILMTSNSATYFIIDNSVFNFHTPYFLRRGFVVARTNMMAIHQRTLLKYYSPVQIMLSAHMPQQTKPLQWRHNGHDSVSNHQPHDCLFSRLFRRRSKKTSKFLVTGLCAGNSPGTSEFPVQMVSNAENLSIWWRHYIIITKWSSLL